MQTPSNREERALSELRRLKRQLDERIISQKEFDEKRKPLLKELVAGSDLAQPQEVFPASPYDNSDFSSPIKILSSGAESDRDLPSENAIRHEYCPITKKWTNTPFQCKIEEQPFAKGAMRVVHRLYDVTATGLDSCFVVKFAINQDSPKEHYFRDVQMQMEARVWAQRYNERCPPKAVDFIAAYVLELSVCTRTAPSADLFPIPTSHLFPRQIPLRSPPPPPPPLPRRRRLTAQPSSPRSRLPPAQDRPGRPVGGVERFIAGEYRKWNSNWGWSDDERDTPQAFSHFTWEASGRRLLVCDIQRVGDLWTDPQARPRPPPTTTTHACARAHTHTLSHRSQLACYGRVRPGVPGRPGESS